MPQSLYLVRPSLGQGGADRVTTILLRHLDRAQFTPMLFLLRARGELLNEVPKDVPVISLDTANVAAATTPLVRLLRTHQPDILFSTSSGTNIPLALAHRITRSKARLVLSERNILYHGGTSAKRRSVVWLKRQLYPRADVILALSQGVKNDLIANFALPPEKIQVAYSPIDVTEIQTQKQTPVAHEWFSQDIPIVVAAGRFVPEKDFATLLTAFAQLRAERPARLVLLGEGPLRSALETQTRSLAIAGDVWFPGFDPNPFKFMSRASAFAVSSEHEGLCTVLIEAMACGAPVVSTDYRVGAREIIDDSVDGFIVPVSDHAALAQKIKLYLDSPELRAVMGKRAAQSALRFDIENQLDAHIKALTG